MTLTLTPFIDTVISCCPLRWDSWAMGQPSPAPGGQPAEGPRTWDDFVIRQNDPINIHQIIIGHLKNVRRESITHIEDLCRIITSACLNSFDHYEIPDEFHFFDFVEHAIGQVVCLRRSKLSNREDIADTALDGPDSRAFPRVSSVPGCVRREQRALIRHGYQDRAGDETAGRD